MSALRREGWRSALEALCTAGEGLAAAHAAGIVHRDFKPENVLVDEDGTLKVGDFGIAHLSRVAVPPRVQDLLGATLGESRVATAGLGTPNYMAPEQHLWLETDVRTDVFAFSVVAYELLYGQRPFVGATWVDLAQSVVAGQVVVPAQRGGVPRGVHAVIHRGLAPKPDDRWPTIRALLDALNAAMQPRRRPGRWLLGVVGAGLLGAPAVLASDPPCPPGATPLPTDIEAHRAALTDAGAAPLTILRTQETLRSYAAGWQLAYDRACERGAPRVIACLQTRRREYEQALSLLQAPDLRPLRQTLARVRHLPEPSSCHDGGDVPELTLLPAEKAVLEALAMSTSDVGANTIAAAKRARMLAVAAGSARLEAEALLVLSDVEGFHSKQRALEHADAALWIALRGGHTTLAAHAAGAGLLLSLDGGDQPGLRESWRRIALDLDERLGPDPSAAKASLLHGLARERFKVGDLVEADRLGRESLQMLESGFATTPVNVAVTLNLLAQVAGARGDFATAVTHAERASQLVAEHVGPSHPRTAEMAAFLGAFLAMSGDLERARLVVERAATDLAAIGARGEVLLPPLNMLAIAEAQLGDYARALGHFETISAVSQGADRPAALQNVSVTAAILGKHDRAIEAARIAVELAQAFERDERTVSGYRTVLGDALLSAGREDEAAAALRQAVQGLETAPRTYPIRRLAEFLFVRASMRRDPSSAVRALEAELHRQHDQPSDLTDPGRVRFFLAQARHAAGEGNAVVLAEAEAAEQELRRLGPVGVPFADRVQRWREATLTPQ